MTAFQLTALLLTILWLALVVVRYRRSTAVLIGGLVVLGLYTLWAILSGRITPDDLGLGVPASWLPTFGFALAGLAILIAYSPLADRLAARWFEKPPTLDAFRGLQESRGRLIAGVVAAWLLGGILEELVARGIVLLSVESWLATWLSVPVAAGAAICIAAAGAGVMHLYQGPRAVLIITQLSALLGLLFVVSGHNLWVVIICHGLYDTIAFIRFANKKSKYATLDPNAALPSE